jgi:hypothetical protein
VTLVAALAAGERLPPLLLNTQAAGFDGHQLVVDTAGNAYLLAEFTAPVACGATLISSPDGTQGLFVAKYNEVGDCQWIVKITQPQVDMFVSTAASLPRARIALSEVGGSGPDVIVGGIYVRSNSDTNTGVVTVGQTDISHSLGANASGVFLAKLSQPTAVPGQPVVPVQVAVTSTLPANHGGYCKDSVEFTGIAVAGSGSATKMLVTLNGRGDCGENVRAEVFESDPFQMSLVNRLQPLGDGGNKHFDVVKARTTGQGAVFVIGGREASTAFVGAYSFAAHNFSWRKILNGAGASPEDVSWGDIGDLEIAVDGQSFWALTSNFFSLYQPGLPRPARTSARSICSSGGHGERRERLGHADGASHPRVLVVDAGQPPGGGCRRTPERRRPDVRDAGDRRFLRVARDRPAGGAARTVGRGLQPRLGEHGNRQQHDTRGLFPRFRVGRWTALPRRRLLRQRRSGLVRRRCTGARPVAAG